MADRDRTPADQALGALAVALPPAVAVLLLQRIDVPDQVGPVGPALEALRVAGLATGGLLAILVAGGAVARLARWWRLVRYLDRLTPASVRGRLNRWSGVGLAAAVVVTTAAPAFADPARGVPSTTAPSPPTAVIRRLPSGTAVLQRLPGEIPRPPTTVAASSPNRPPASPARPEPLPAPRPVPEPAPVATPEPSSPSAARPRTWTVRAGEHLWGIAEATLEDAWSRPVTDREIEPYWRSLVSANRSRLVDPANADLILSGQVLVVPATPPRPPS